MLRPLTNCNFVLDFFRHREAPYHKAITQYLAHRGHPVPQYTKQYDDVLAYFEATEPLHGYGKFAYAYAPTAAAAAINARVSA